MSVRPPIGFLVFLAVSAAPLAFAQEGQPATGDTTSYQLDLHAGSNLVALPVLPGATDIEAIVADLLPHLTLVQDDAGRYFIPSQAITELDTWRWNEAYRIVLATPTTLTVEGPEIHPELSPLLVERDLGNWVPYLRDTPSSVEDAFASVAPHLLRVEDADGRFFVPGGEASTLDSLRTGEGYKVWVSQPVTLTYPANPTPPDSTLPDAVPPAAPSGLTATAGDDAIELDWHDNTEDDLPATPYEILRSATSGGGYTHLAWRVESSYTDASDLAEGTTYYYVVKARDEAGNVSPASAEASAALDISLPEPIPFALPASSTPTALEEGIGMRAEFRDDPKSFNDHPGSAYDGATTQGERLWLGVGGTGYDYGHPLTAVEPDGEGGIIARYINASGTLSVLPSLGAEPQDAYTFCHEGTNVGARIDLPGGGTAVHLNIMDGACNPSYSFRVVEEADGGLQMDTLTLDGSPWVSGAKHHALEASADGLAVMHAHGAYPDLIIDGDGDGDFHAPSTDYTGQSHSVFRLGAVADTIWFVSSEKPALSKIVRTGPDAASITRVTHSLGVFWGNEFDASGGFGATVKYVGPAGDNPGFVLYSNSSGLDYHTGTYGSVVPVDGVEALAYQNIGGETWRILPDLRIQRLASLSVGPTSTTATWVTEADLDLPAGWSSAAVAGAEITERGSVWLINESTPTTFPLTGVTANDISVAYYRGGS